MKSLLGGSWILWWATVLALTFDTPARSQAIKPSSPYAYNGGAFSITVTFRALVNYEFDGSAGGDLGNPGWIVVSNLASGKTASFPYLYCLRLPQAAPASAISGNYTIYGTLTIDADELGTGPLTFEVLGVTVAYRPMHPPNISSVYGEYLNATLLPVKFEVALPPYQVTGQQSAGLIPGQPVQQVPPGANAHSKIHAVIISGLSDPAKVIASPNVMLTGGIVALGKNPISGNPSTWSPGLQIVPDYGLLTGEKIPPVTPNLVDVRIVRQEVTADFPSPNPQPSN
jgi:hypothetical protein